MLRRRPDGLYRSFVAAICAVTFLILFGYVLLLFNPPSDLDRKCLKESMMTMRDCVNDYYQSRK